MHTINRRPTGMSLADMILTPSDVIPIWSRLNPKNMLGASKCLRDAMTVFKKKWDELYCDSIKRQQKWMSTNHDLQILDIVIIKDLNFKFA